MAVEAATGPAKGKVIRRDIGPLFSGDLDNPFVDAGRVLEQLGH